MTLCAGGYGTCSCFASGCGYIGSDNTVYGCESTCCQGKCPGQVSNGKTLGLDYDAKTTKYLWALAALLIFLAVLSTISLI